MSQAKKVPSQAKKVPSQAELGHFNFQAETKLSIYMLMNSFFLLKTFYFLGFTQQTIHF